MLRHTIPKIFSTNYAEKHHPLKTKKRLRPPW